MTGLLVGVRIVTPGDWTDLDLDPATRHRSIRRLVRFAIDRDPALGHDVFGLLRLLDGVSGRAADAGAVFCSSLVRDFGSGGILVANVLIQISGDHVFGAPPAPASRAADALCAGIASAASCDPAWAGADMSVVSLPLVGEAVRLEVISRGICVQYVVPIPGDSRQIVLTFTSPGLLCSEALLDLFDSMAASFGLTYESSDSLVAAAPVELESAAPVE